MRYFEKPQQLSSKPSVSKNNLLKKTIFTNEFELNDFESQFKKAFYQDLERQQLLKLQSIGIRVLYSNFIVMKTHTK